MQRLRDRFNLATGKPKTPILAQAPEPRGDENRAVMRIYDPIDSFGEWFGLSAREFGQALDALPESVEEIELHINSPGGEVHEGLAILNQIRQHKASVTVVIDGLAASAASFIAMGADEVLIAPNAEVMVHFPWALAVGDAADMRKAADDLDRLALNLARIYAGKAGGTVDDWLEAMRVESWYSDEEAVAAGLADGVFQAVPETAAEARFNLGVFAHAGRAAAPSPYIPRAAQAAAGPRPAELSALPEKEGADPMSDLTKGLRNRLGIAENAELTDDQLLEALDEALDEQAEPTPAEPAPAEIPEGTQLIDTETLQALQADAEAGREALAAQALARRAAAVDSAIRAGKFGPARRDAWLARLEVDEEGGLADLERLTPGLVPVNEVGSTGDGTADPDESAYNRIFGTKES